MRHPNTYSAIEVKQWATEEEYKPGKWAPSRPLPYYGIRHIWRTLKITWGVFIGKYDALNWNGDKR